jgi:hypothetical protein
MSQQHLQFEEEFRDGPPSAASYQAGYAGPQISSANPQPVAYPANVPLSQSYVNIPGQKLLVHDLNANHAPGVGARLALSILSLIFTFFMFLVTLGIIAGTRFNPSPVAPVAIFFALIFAVMVIIINVIFNRRH